MLPAVIKLLLKNSMLHLHNTNLDVILFGLLSEITEYARYAREGK